MNALELKVPPLAVAIGFAATMWGIAVCTPSLPVSIRWMSVIDAVLFAVGVAFALAGLFEFRKAKTTFNPIQPETSSALVVSGIYSVSRNPMYVGLLPVLAGWAVFLSHVSAFVFMPIFAVYIYRFQIVPEETHSVNAF